MRGWSMKEEIPLVCSLTLKKTKKRERRGEFSQRPFPPLQQWQPSALCDSPQRGRASVRCAGSPTPRDPPILAYPLSKTSESHPPNLPAAAERPPKRAIESDVKVNVLPWIMPIFHCCAINTSKRNQEDKCGGGERENSNTWSSFCLCFHKASG